MKINSSTRRLTRRSFLQQAFGAGVILGFPTIIPSRLLGQDAPSNRITAAAVGLGWQGSGNWGTLSGLAGIQAVATCDLELARAEQHAQGKNGCKPYFDYREMFEKEKPDVVTIAVPDHWHALVATEALRRGIDVHGEKPLARTLRESRAIVNAAKRYGRVWQTGSWQRSTANFQTAVDLVRNGHLGKIQKVVVELGDGVGGYGAPKNSPIQDPPPSDIHYDLWVGPAAWRPYRANTHHKFWRFANPFGGAILMDWIGHHGDIALWGLDRDHTGPVKIEATGSIATLPEWDTVERYQATLTFADGLPLQVIGGAGSNATWYGEKGWIKVGRELLDSNPKSLLDDHLSVGERRVGRGVSHFQDFIDCVKNRQECIAPAEAAHRAASLGHLIEIGIHTGRTLQWDPEKEEILHDPMANSMLQRPYREPWIFPAV